MDVIDAQSGQVIPPNRLFIFRSDPAEWFTIVEIRFRTPLTRTAFIEYRDGRREEVVMPVKLFPRLTYGPRFPSRVVAAVFPS